MSLKAVEEFRKICPPELSLVQFALKWILMSEAVTCAIPGAKNISQAAQNISASDLPDLSNDIMEQVKNIYERYIKREVHHLW